MGSTELAIVTLLARHEVALETAALAAVGVRLSTLWFSILCGLASIAVLEAVAAIRLADVEALAAAGQAGDHPELGRLLELLGTAADELSESLSHRYLVHATPQRRLGDAAGPMAPA